MQASTFLISALDSNWRHGNVTDAVDCPLAADSSFIALAQDFIAHDGDNSGAIPRTLFTLVTLSVFSILLSRVVGRLMGLCKL